MAFQTHTGEIPTEEKLQEARKHAAKINRDLAADSRSGKLEFAAHCDNPEFREQYAKKQIRAALDIENGLSDDNFTIWQRMNTHLTGECIALLYKPKPNT